MSEQIKTGDYVYFAKLNKKVYVKYIDGNYAYIVDNDDNSYSIHISELRKLRDMTADEILQNEG
jgi:hypothetical protein